MRIGTRGSALALAQAEHVARLLGANPPAELVTITTTGDRAAASLNEQPAEHHDLDRTPGTPATDRAPQGAVEDKSRWVDTIEQALLAGEIDLAVHSAKDVPGELAEGLSLLGAPARAPAEDVLCGASALEALPEGARVGTSSVRRAAQLRATREDLQIVPIGGNVDTRLRRLGEWREAGEPRRAGEQRDAGGGRGEDRLHAIVLARAGLVRLGREDEVGAVLDPARFVPAPGQGVLALEGRAEDARVKEAVAAITDADTFACLHAERAVANGLGASCHTPLGAHATPAGCGCLTLRAWVGLPDGSEWISDELAETGIRAEGACLPASVGGFYDPDALGLRVAERMRSAGAEELLRRAQEMAVEHA
jgi:hydroxymethylbilane synthase